MKICLREVGIQDGWWMKRAQYRVYYGSLDFSSLEPFDSTIRALGLTMMFRGTFTSFSSGLRNSFGEEQLASGF
jgi:hypothetical protein